MIKGIYTSGSAMLPRVKKQEMVANNLANAASTGFKKDRLFMAELSEAEAKAAGKRTEWHKPMLERSYIDFAPGVFDKTDNPLDLAIEGDGFFELISPEGETVLTRSGAFQVDENGLLSYPGGFLVSGDGGPIQVGNGKVTVGRTGIIEVDGLPAGQITPVSVADTQNLERLGGTLFRVPENEEVIPAQSYQVMQGYLEQANVDVVREMVEMMISYRAYEANARAMTTQDESLDDLFTKVAGGR